MSAVEVIKESSASSDLRFGHQVAANAALSEPPIQLTPNSIMLNRGVLIRCPGAKDPVPNLYPVWVGFKGVTPDSNPDTGGMPVVPGSSLFLPVDDPSELYIISTNADQEAAWLGA
jgi:hypothetical protein